MHLQLLCGFAVNDHFFGLADRKPAVRAFAVLPGIVTTAVAADQFILGCRRIVAFAISHLLPEIARHLAMGAFHGMIVIDGIAIVTDQHGLIFITEGEMTLVANTENGRAVHLVASVGVKEVVGTLVALAVGIG